ncbi:MAG: TetR/AcrR family transcriptional regulator [Rhodoferax sp.]
MERKSRPSGGHTNELAKRPLQARSLESTERMLDAVLAILARDGASGLTVAAVSREAGVSNSSIYHRFSDRQGLLVAAQARFLSLLEAQWLDPKAPLWENQDLDGLLSQIVSAFEDVFSKYRGLFRAFMIEGYADPGLHQRGAQASVRTASFFRELITERFGCTPEAADSGYRILFSHACISAIFDWHEVSNLCVRNTDRRQHLVQALRGLFGQV